MNTVIVVLIFSIVWLVFGGFVWLFWGRKEGNEHDVIENRGYLSVKDVSLKCKDTQLAAKKMFNSINKKTK